MLPMTYAQKAQTFRMNPFGNSKAIERILSALREAPGLSRRGISERAYVGETTLSGGGYLKQMKQEGLIHVSGWLRNASGAFTTPLYSLGREVDCKRPRITRENRSAPGMKRLLDAIRDYGPIDYRQAAKITGLSPNTVKGAGYLEALVRQRAVHVSGWRRARNGPMRPIYDFGHGIGTPKHEPRTRAEISRDHRWRKLGYAGSLAIQARMAASDAVP